MRSYACLLGVLAVCLSMATGRMGAGEGRLDPRRCEGCVRSRAAGGDDRSPQPAPRRRQSTAVGRATAATVFRRCRRDATKSRRAPGFQRPRRSPTSSCCSGRRSRSTSRCPSPADRIGTGDGGAPLIDVKHNAATASITQESSIGSRAAATSRASSTPRPAPTTSRATAAPDRRRRAARRTASSSTAWTRRTCARASRARRSPRSTSSPKCRSRPRATPRNTAARPAASSAPSRRAAATLPRQRRHVLPQQQVAVCAA